MGKFKALLKFEFMSNASQYKDEGAFSRVRRALLSIIGSGLFVAVFLYAINIIMRVFVEENMQHEFITLFLFAMFALHLVLGISAATKILFTKVDLSIIKLPVNGIEIFISKFIYLYIKQLIFSALITLPTLIMFGIHTSQSVLFFVLVAPFAIFLPLIPLMFAIVLSVPVMWIINVFKTKFLFLLVMYTLAIIVGFMIYIAALKFILRVFENGSVADVLDEGTIYKIKQFTSYLYLPLLLKNLVLIYNYTKSLVINLAIIICLGAFIYFFAKKFYFSLLISSKNQRAFVKKTKVVSHKPAAALMKKEFKNIFRSTNYAFQYLTVVFTTPLMVYFSSKIVSFISTPSFGADILPGVAVLLLIMFLSMGTSFSATSITREGNNFFLTKIIPVSFKQQITIKFLMYIMISIPAIFVSCIVLAVAGFVDILTAVIIAVSLSFVIVGNICYSIIMDIKRPQFQYLENGEVSSNNKNITSSIGIGFIVSFIMGAGGIVLSLLVGVPSMYSVLIGFSIPFATIGLFRLFFRLEKKYYNIEV